MIGKVIAFGGGFLLARHLYSQPAPVVVPNAPTRDYPPFRLADDFIYTTDTLRPLMLKLREASRGGSISPGGAAQVVDELVGLF